ncbi:MAG: T9SS type A sorting domain-containing protein [Bacteroidia bacterium]|nr:T9SS type A sorting domain-containing protein [Bacteroidia bacterium]
MKLLRILLLSLVSTASFAQQFCAKDTAYPFTTDSVHIKIWNKTEYVPFFIKGVNMGVAVPGKFPGELAVNNAQYGRWFGLIKEAGFNCIRLYTLHYPNFYQVLDSFNLANPTNPLYFFQGIWLEEELPGYNQDLFYLSSFFQNEIEENIDCVHGNRIIAQRFGKAYGTYTANVSKWNIGYIIGRETFPEEVLMTNQTHPNDTVYNGVHFSLVGKPADVFVAGKLDHVADYEQTHYQTQRPVSYSSWPTLDPLHHASELYRYEDTASIDFSNIDFHLAPAGVFASYHAYPYYPDFVADDSTYQTYTDMLGNNSYVGYLTDLKSHYPHMPLIIAETGVPSSWGIAHYATNGMHHGGANQQLQGETMLRLFHNVKDTKCGGAIDFAWIDEWFKSTWITYPLDYDIDRRILWHNVMSPEQNYGLIGFTKPTVMENWASFGPNQPISKITASADYDYFRINLSLGEQINNPDDIWIGLDTYRADLGESILPNGDTILNRAEFALHITNYTAQLYVTQAYDIFGIWGNTSGPNQLYHSIPTDGAPWNISRWKTNNAFSLLVYVGNLKVKNSFLPPASDDAITIYDDSVHIRLPWTLLHFTDPSQMTVFNDYRATPAPEDTTSNGIQITAIYHQQKAIPPSRYSWPSWNTVQDLVEYKKSSYHIVKNGLAAFNTAAMAISDTYLSVDSFPYQVNAANGLLKNDYDLDGNTMQALLIGNAHHGSVTLNFDGSYTYVADPGYVGTDYFEYSLFDGVSLSQTAYVCLEVDNTIGVQEVEPENAFQVSVFPNPAKDMLTVKADNIITAVSVFNAEGKLVLSKEASTEVVQLDVSSLSDGIYFVKTNANDKVRLHRISVNN